MKRVINFERDFKGVWIPKEIWLNEELSILDVVVYTEIASLDTENHCTASNQYLADFCGVSEKSISRTITKLIDLKLIYVHSFDGRNRCLARVDKMSTIDKMSDQSRQNVQADQTKCPAININNNTSINNYKENIVTNNIKEDELKSIINSSFKQEDLVDKSGIKYRLYEKLLDYVSTDFRKYKITKDRLLDYLKFLAGLNNFESCLEILDIAIKNNFSNLIYINDHINDFRKKSTNMNFSTLHFGNEEKELNPPTPQVEKKPRELDDWTKALLAKHSQYYREKNHVNEFNESILDEGEIK